MLGPGPDLAQVGWLDPAVRLGPDGAGGGLSAALLELVAVGLAAGSAAFGEGALTTFPRLLLGRMASAISYRRSANTVLTCSAT
ncbi:hypothetical protein [Kitasatospora griseola]